MPKINVPFPPRFIYECARLKMPAFKFLAKQAHTLDTMKTLFERKDFLNDLPRTPIKFKQEGSLIISGSDVESVVLEKFKVESKGTVNLTDEECKAYIAFSNSLGGEFSQGGYLRGNKMIIINFLVESLKNPINVSEEGSHLTRSQLDPKKLVAIFACQKNGLDIEYSFHIKQKENELKENEYIAEADTENYKFSIESEILSEMVNNANENLREMRTLNINDLLRFIPLLIDPEFTKVFVEKLAQEKRLDLVAWADHFVSLCFEGRSDDLNRIKNEFEECGIKSNLKHIIEFNKKCDSRQTSLEDKLIEDLRRIMDVVLKEGEKADDADEIKTLRKMQILLNEIDRDKKIQNLKEVSDYIADNPKYLTGLVTYGVSESACAPILDNIANLANLKKVKQFPLALPSNDLDGLKGFFNDASANGISMSESERRPFYTCYWQDKFNSECEAQQTFLVRNLVDNLRSALKILPTSNAIKNKSKTRPEDLKTLDEVENILRYLDTPRDEATVIRLNNEAMDKFNGNSGFILTLMKMSDCDATSKDTINQQDKLIKENLSKLAKLKNTQQSLFNVPDPKANKAFAKNLAEANNIKLTQLANNFLWISLKDSNRDLFNVAKELKKNGIDMYLREIGLLQRECDSYQKHLESVIKKELNNLIKESGGKDTIINTLGISKLDVETISKNLDNIPDLKYKKGLSVAVAKFKALKEITDASFDPAVVNNSERLQIFATKFIDNEAKFKASADPQSDKFIMRVKIILTAVAGVLIPILGAVIVAGALAMHSQLTKGSAKFWKTRDEIYHDKVKKANPKVSITTKTR